MRKDIESPEVKDVKMAVAKLQNDEWAVYIINSGPLDLHDAMVVSKGYGLNKGEEVQTSTLRHMVGFVESRGASAVERMDPEIFHLTHEFWLTFYINGKIYDRKFIFKSGTLSEENLLYIEELKKEGIIQI